MKGPGLRLELDVRRTWRCAVCGSERHTAGSVTFVACHFCQDHPPMSLIEPQRPTRAPAAPLDMVIGLHPDDVDAPAFVPAHLREMDEERPAETATDTEISTAPPEEVHATDVDEAPAIEDEAPSTDEPGDGRKARRKKNRRKRRRKKAEASHSTSQGSVGTDSPADATSADATASPDDAFGTGLDS